MARTAKNSKIDSRTARLRLPMRREPYWTKISSGCHLGYRRLQAGGSWIGRFRDGATGKRVYGALGAADDYRDADAVTVFDFDRAQEKAREFFKREAEKLAGEWTPGHDTITVAEGMSLYLADYKARGGKSFGATKNTIDAHILPELGTVKVAALTRTRIKAWRDKLVTTPPRLRIKAGQPQRYRKQSTVKQRRSSANRILTVLKAALNFLAREGKISCRPVWQLVPPFKNVDGARTRFLSDDEARAIVAKCPVDFQELVTGALLTGCRFGELAALKAGDYRAESGSIFIAESKSGKSRHVYLTDEGKALFSNLARSRARGDFLFMRANGRQWGKSDQQRPMVAACKAAKIEYLTFHELRHSYASKLVMRGVSLKIVADQLGHSDTRMVEKHYGHLAPSYVANTVRAAFNPMFSVSKEVAN